MKRTIKVFFIGFGLILLVAVLIGLALPNEWSAEARVTIDAEPAVIHPYVSDFEQWQVWATDNMKTEDPTAEVTVTGTGVGATMTWTGDRMGQGRIVITESDPARGISYDAAIKSDELNGRGWIRYEVTPEGTVVTWHDEGDLPPVIGSYFAGMVNQTLSEHFEKSLTKLKGAVEGE